MKNDLPKFESKGINLELVLNEYLYLAEKFVCYFCKNIVKDPHCCGKCQECFCMECFNLYKKRKNAKCPNFDSELGKICNNRLEEGYDITNREKMLLNQIKLKCMNFQGGCEEILSYENFFKHIKACKLRIYKCSNKDCDFQSTKEKINEHKLTCQYSKSICEYCKEEIVNNKITEHHQVCEEIDRLCFFCKKSFKVKNLYNHNPVCKRDFLNFANEENMRKIEEYDGLLEKLVKLENDFKVMKTGGSNKILLGRKKKVIIDDDERSRKSLEIDQEEKVKNEEFDKKRNDVESDENNIEDLLWINNKKEYKLSKYGKLTFSSNLGLKFDFKITVKVKYLSEKNNNFAIGFSEEPIMKSNYTIGNSKSYQEWAIHKDGLLTEKNCYNNYFQGKISIGIGDIIELFKKDDLIGFTINGNTYEYSYNFVSQSLYLICSLMYSEEEIEILDFAYN